MLALILSLAFWNAHATDFTILNSGATKGLMTQEAALFANKSNNHMTLTVAAGPALVRDRVQAGEIFDIAVANSEFIVDLANSGHLVPNSQFCMSRTNLGLGVRQGVGQIDISTLAKFKTAMLALHTLAYATEGTSGPHLLQKFKELGIDAVMQPKLRPMTAPQAIAAVANGTVEAAVLLTSSLATGAGVEVAGILPSEVQLIS